MNDFKIEKGIPAPVAAKRNGVTATLRSMQVGDSFLYPKAKRTALSQLFRNCKPSEFMSRTADEQYVRVWRTA